MTRFSFFLLLLLCSCAHGPRAPRSAPRNPPPAAVEPLAADFQAENCRALSDRKRRLLLEIANPGNFPGTRYRRGPAWSKGIEAETDCSHFVYEIYRRAGLPFPFRPTGEMRGLREFDILPESEALPGDLMLFRGHVGIVDEKGRIISALRSRRKRRGSSIAAIDRKFFSSFRGRRYVLRYRCEPAASGTREPASERLLP